MTRLAAGALLYVAGAQAFRRGHAPVAERLWRRGHAVLAPTVGGRLGARLSADCLGGLSRVHTQVGRYEDGARLADAAPALLRGAPVGRGWGYSERLRSTTTRGSRCAWAVDLTKPRSQMDTPYG